MVRLFVLKVRLTVASVSDCAATIGRAFGVNRVILKTAKVFIKPLSETLLIKSAKITVCGLDECY